MKPPNEHVLALWRMSPAEFNEWRRHNDLPLLLGFFQQDLPHFKEWQAAHAITDETFLAAKQPSKFFSGRRTMYLSSSTGPDYDAGKDTTTVHFHDRPISGRDSDERQKQLFGEVRYQTNWSIWFVPYFHWLRTERQMRKFRVPGEANDFTDDFNYRKTEAVNTIYSRAYLFRIHNVLKLGGVTIPASHFDDRNIDFVDLDRLVVVGGGGSRETSIAYASCRHIVFKNYTKPFVVFEKSPLESPRFEDGHLERFRFIDSVLSRPIFRNVRMSRCELASSTMWEPTFDGCDLVDLKVTSPRGSAEYLADFYRRLRVAFQSQGNRAEVSKFYFHERFQRMWSQVIPIIPSAASGLPRLVYADSLWSLYEQWQLGRMTVRKIAFFLSKNLIQILKILLYPPYLLRFLTTKSKVIPELFDWLLWGFGEKPIRIFIWMLGVISGFGASYYFGQNPLLKGNLVESLSCSVANFATTDCPHAGSVDGPAEAILGVILLGMMVAGFSNRTRY